MKIKNHTQIGQNGPNDPIEKAYAADVIGGFVERNRFVHQTKFELRLAQLIADAIKGGVPPSQIREALEQQSQHPRLKNVS